MVMNHAVAQHITRTTLMGMMRTLLRADHLSHALVKHAVPQQDTAVPKPVVPQGYMHWCVMCGYETGDTSAAYEHGRMKPVAPQQDSTTPNPLQDNRTQWNPLTGWDTPEGYPTPDRHTPRGYA